MVRRCHRQCLISKKRKGKKRQFANAVNMRPANLEAESKEQIKQRHACRCRARGWGRGVGGGIGGCTRREDHE